MFPSTSSGNGFALRMFYYLEVPKVAALMTETPIALLSFTDPLGCSELSEFVGP